MNNPAQKAKASLTARHRAESRFRWYGRIALLIAFAMLAILLGSLAGPGLNGFLRSEAKLIISRPAEDIATLSEAGTFARQAWKEVCPQVHNDAENRQLLRLLAPGYEKEAFAQLRDAHGANQALWLPLIYEADRYLRANFSGETSLTDIQKQTLIAMHDRSDLRRVVHWGFITHGDSRFPEKAGMAVSIVGSLFLLAVTMGIAFPVGIGAAIFLEEFSRKGKLRDLIEVNINNLAAVPSIVYGLLGLAVYLNLFGLPRSSSLAGGLTLALMTLPVIIITTRASLAAVPPSIKHGALVLGASPLQVVLHHTLPLALPGILTGTILGMARAIGETAPLILIGMVAFIADIPGTPVDPATAMPVQIYLWASSPEAGFAEKTASGILVLLVLLLCLNAVAIILRRKYERRW